MKPSFNKNTLNSTNNKVKNNIDVKNRTKTKKKTVANNKTLTNPIKKNSTPNKHSGQVINGYFINEKSYREILIARINYCLSIFLGVLILFCLVTYYFVSCKEVQLNKISKETLELNYENDELQYKVDSLQSYYNIDKAVSKSNILERATKVVEVNAINVPKTKTTSKHRPKIHSVVVNY